MALAIHKKALLQLAVGWYLQIGCFSNQQKTSFCVIFFCVWVFEIWTLFDRKLSVSIYYHDILLHLVNKKENRHIADAFIYGLLLK